MGKKKKGGGAQKTAEKTAKKEKKKLLKENQEDDIEDILKSIRADDEKITSSSLLILDGGWSNPSVPPRCNCCALAFNTVDSQHSSQNTVILFGGEHNDGRHVFVYGDLLLYNYAKNELRRWVLPHPPPPRSAHCFVATDGPSPSYYVFGGEFQSKSGEQFHHYKDMWRLSAGDGGWQWTEVKAKNPPSPRSGCRCVYYKRNIYFFGGFHDSGRRTEYFNDLHIFSTDTMEWKEVKSPSTPWPSQRSGFCFWVDDVAGVAYVYGGTGMAAKDPKGKKSVSAEDLIVYSDLWQLDLNGFQWTQIKKKGIFPSKRAGMTAVAIPGKQRAFLFGGVIDEDEEPMGAAKTKEGTFKGEKSKTDKRRHDTEEDDNGDDDDDLSHSLFLNDLYVFNGMNAPPSCHFVEMKGDVVSRTETFVMKPKSKDKDKGEGKDDEGETTSTSVFDFDPTMENERKEKIENKETNPSPTISSSSAVVSPPRTPHPRLTPSVVYCDHHILLYGGVFESSDDRQFVLNDWWILDTTKPYEWKCVVELDEEKMKAIQSDDEEEHDEEEEQETDDEKDKNKDGDTVDDECDGVEECCDSDTNIDSLTVVSGETIATYFQRLKSHFMERANTVLMPSENSVAPSEKDRRKVAFDMAREEYAKRTKEA